MTAEDVAKGLAKPRRSGNGWTACCPAHDDQRPSLSISDGLDGKVLLHCFAGCRFEDIAAALQARGVELNGSSAPASGPDPPLSHPELGAYQRHWDYLSRHGLRLLRVCRWDMPSGKKEIRPLSQTAEGWRWKQLPDSRPLFHLPELCADDSLPVLVVEGELTAAAAQALLPQFIVTTWAGGVNAVGRTDWSPLARRKCLLVPDADEPGRGAMDAIAALLAQIKAQVLIADSSAYPEGWDIADALTDEDKSAVKEWLADYQFAPEKPKTRFRSAAEIVSTPIPIQWLIRPYFEHRVLGVIFGELGTFKSFLAMDIMLHVATGKPWAGSTFAPKQYPVAYVSAEGRGMDRRLRAWSKHHAVSMEGVPFFALERALDLSSDERLVALADEIAVRCEQPGVVVIDTLSRNKGPLDENKTSDMALFFSLLDAHLRQRFGCSVLVVHHVGHGAKDRTRGSYTIMGDTDANYLVERPDPAQPVIKLSTGRLKDAESPAPIYLKARSVDLGTLDDDGVEESSMVLVRSDEATASEPKRTPTGSQQRKLLRLLEKSYKDGTRTWLQQDIRAIARDRLGMGKSSAHAVTESLIANGFVRLSVGGCILTEPPVAP